jgi:ATP-dependent Clp protease ATP-binding subunit ClpC
MENSNAVDEDLKIVSYIATDKKSDDSIAEEYTTLLKELMKELKKFFKPEFLNRLDDVIVFNQLEKEHIFKIFDVEIMGLKNRISVLGYTLDISEKMKDYVVNEGFDIENGARPLKRSIEKHIEDPISEELLKVDYVNEKIVVTIKKRTKKINK